MATTVTDEAVRRARLAAPAQLLRATIKTTPASDDELVYVTVTRQSRTARRGPCAWMPRGTARPTAGDPCWVQESDRPGELVVVCWMPQ